MLQLDLGRIALKVGQINKSPAFPGPLERPIIILVFFFLLEEAQ